MPRRSAPYAGDLCVDVFVWSPIVGQRTQWEQVSNCHYSSVLWKTQNAQLCKILYGKHSQPADKDQPVGRPALPGVAKSGHLPIFLPGSQLGKGPSAARSHNSLASPGRTFLPQPSAVTRVPILWEIDKWSSSGRGCPPLHWGQKAPLFGEFPNLIVWFPETCLLPLKTKSCFA